MTPRKRRITTHAKSLLTSWIKSLVLLRRFFLIGNSLTSDPLFIDPRLPPRSRTDLATFAFGGRRNLTTPTLTSRGLVNIPFLLFGGSQNSLSQPWNFKNFDKRILFAKYSWSMVVSPAPAASVLRALLSSLFAFLLSFLLVMLLYISIFLCYLIMLPSTLFLPTTLSFFSGLLPSHLFLPTTASLFTFYSSFASMNSAAATAVNANLYFLSWAQYLFTPSPSLLSALFDSHGFEGADFLSAAFGFVMNLYYQTELWRMRDLIFDFQFHLHFWQYLDLDYVVYALFFALALALLAVYFFLWVALFVLFSSSDNWRLLLALAYSKNWDSRLQEIETLNQSLPGGLSPQLANPSHGLLAFDDLKSKSLLRYTNTLEAFLDFASFKSFFGFHGFLNLFPSNDTIWWKHRFIRHRRAFADWVRRDRNTLLWSKLPERRNTIHGFWRARPSHVNIPSFSSRIQSRFNNRNSRDGSLSFFKQNFYLTPARLFTYRASFLTNSLEFLAKGSVFEYFFWQAKNTIYDYFNNRTSIVDVSAHFDDDEEDDYSISDEEMVGWAPHLDKQINAFNFYARELAAFTASGLVRKTISRTRLANFSFNDYLILNDYTFRTKEYNYSAHFEHLEETPMYMSSDEGLPTKYDPFYQSPNPRIEDYDEFLDREEEEEEEGEDDVITESDAEEEEEEEEEKRLEFTPFDYEIMREFEDGYLYKDVNWSDVSHHMNEIDADNLPRIKPSSFGRKMQYHSYDEEFATIMRTPLFNEVFIFDRNVYANNAVSWSAKYPLGMNDVPDSFHVTRNFTTLYDDLVDLYWLNSDTPFYKNFFLHPPGRQLRVNFAPRRARRRGRSYVVRRGYWELKKPILSAVFFGYSRTILLDFVFSLFFYSFFATFIALSFVWFLLSISFLSFPLGPFFTNFFLIALFLLVMLLLFLSPMTYLSRTLFFHFLSLLPFGSTLPWLFFLYATSFYHLMTSTSSPLDLDTTYTGVYSSSFSHAPIILRYGVLASYADLPFLPSADLLAFNYHPFLRNLVHPKYSRHVQYVSPYRAFYLRSLLVRLFAARSLISSRPAPLIRSSVSTLPLQRTSSPAWWTSTSFAYPLTPNTTSFLSFRFRILPYIFSNMNYSPLVLSAELSTSLLSEPSTFHPQQSHFLSLLSPHLSFASDSSSLSCLSPASFWSHFIFLDSERIRAKSRLTRPTNLIAPSSFYSSSIFTSLLLNRLKLPTYPRSPTAYSSTDVEQDPSNYDSPAPPPLPLLHPNIHEFAPDYSTGFITGRYQRFSQLSRPRFKSKPTTSMHRFSLYHQLDPYLQTQEPFVSEISSLRSDFWQLFAPNFLLDSVYWSRLQTTDLSLNQDLFYASFFGETNSRRNKLFANWN